MGGFRWTGRREQAALLVAEDRLTNAEIAAKVGVSRQALDKWKADPEFRERVRQNVEQLRHSVLEVGIHDRSCRVAALQDRWRRLPAVIDARTAEMRDIPGGASGLLVKQCKLSKAYESEGDDEGGDSVTPIRRVRWYLERASHLQIIPHHQRQSLRMGASFRGDVHVLHQSAR